MIKELHAMHIDVGCYVADALDADERAAFEEHLTECESCSREVVEFSETSAELARIVAMTPPPTIRGSLLTAIRAVRPLPPVTEDRARTLRQAQEKDQDLGALSPSEGNAPGALTLRQAQEKDAPAKTQDELARRRAGGRSSRGSGRNRMLTALIAAAAVVALALGGWVYNLTQGQPTDVVAGAAAARQAELMSAPDAKIYATSRDGAQYSFVVSKQRNAALFLGTDLTDPGANQTFQLWTLQGRRAFPDALMAASADSQWFDGPIATSTSLAISVEPAGGAQQPSRILAQVTI